jgi:hypothetical protein
MVMDTLNLRLPMLAICLFGSGVAWASGPAPQLTAGSVYMFRDIRGINDVGLIAGDVLQYGANVIGGSADVTVSATAADGFFDPAAHCAPLAVNPNFCANATAYDAGRLDPWTLHFRRNGATTSVLGPSMQGVAATPFPTSVTLSGSGLTPTISWQLPAGVQADGFRINIYDKDHKRENGVADIISSNSLSLGATSFTLPAGLTLSGHYAIGFQVIETRGHIAFSGNNAEIFSRSNSTFDFTPQADGAHDVALPTIDAGGVYHFDIDGVGADHVSYIDPVVATGFHYETGGAGPNFRSVLLPNVGDGRYTLSFSDASGGHLVELDHDQQYFFGADGVSAFSINGIEASAGVQPGDGTGFVTGLSFVAAGRFTGTMTPITSAVPEPASWMMTLLGVTMVARLRRRRAA